MGTIAVSGAGLTALKACELLMRHIIVYLEAMVVDYFQEIFFDV